MSQLEEGQWVRWITTYTYSKIEHSNENPETIWKNNERLAKVLHIDDEQIVLRSEALRNLNPRAGETEEIVKLQAPYDHLVKPL